MEPVMHDKHGATKGRWTKEYRAWVGAKQRSTNRKGKQWKDYGGRGVRMCWRWMNSFPAFLEDMGRCPDPKLTLDRIDNERGYEPGNCRWVSRAEQNRNKRNSTRLTHDGRTMNLVDWAREIGLEPNTLSRRLRNHPVEVAVRPSSLKLSGATGLKGALLDKRSGRYYTLRVVNGRRLYAGEFDTPEEAAMAYKKLSVPMQGA